MSDRVVVVERPATHVTVARTGPQGVPGPAGSGGQYLYHDQTTPTASVTIAHGFGRRPTVAVLVGGAVAIADVDHPSTSAVTITLATPQTFAAVLTA